MSLTVFPTVIKQSGTTIILYDYDGDGDNLSECDKAKIQLDGLSIFDVKFVSMIHLKPNSKKYIGAALRISVKPEYRDRFLGGSTGKLTGSLTPKTLSGLRPPTDMTTFDIDPEVVVTIIN